MVKKFPSRYSKMTLDDFLAWIEKFKDVLCAHNGKRFDLPVLVSELANVNKLDRFINYVTSAFDSANFPQGTS